MKKRVKKSKVHTYNKTALGTSALTLSISGIFLTFFTSIVIAPLFLILSLIFSIIQQVKNPTKIGKVSLILSIVGILVYVAWVLILIFVISPNISTVY
ncbi:MAG: hypothetical protein WC812_04435 [Candidatus Pacearchaeota archaeon]|jgi:hypothetical protein